MVQKAFSVLKQGRLFHHWTLIFRTFPIVMSLSRIGTVGARMWQPSPGPSPKTHQLPRFSNVRSREYPPARGQTVRTPSRSPPSRWWTSHRSKNLGINNIKLTLCWAAPIDCLIPRKLWWLQSVFTRLMKKAKPVFTAEKTPFCKLFHNNLSQIWRCRSQNRHNWRTNSSKSQWSLCLRI
jgi:hypothetical protein